MKKIALVLMAFSCLSLSSQAFVDNQYMQTDAYLLNTGYSTEIGKMMRIVSQDPYRTPYVEKKTPENYAKRVINYISPVSYTDLNFYNHDSNYDSSTWTDL